MNRLLFFLFVGLTVLTLSLLLPSLNARQERKGTDEAGKSNQSEQPKEAVDFDPTKPPTAAAANKRELRRLRWMIVFPREDADVFLKKIAELKAFLVIPEDTPGTKYYICENLEKKPFEWKTTDLKAINSHRRLWTISHDNKDCNLIATACSLKETPPWITIFLPSALEEDSTPSFSWACAECSCAPFGAA